VPDTSAELAQGGLIGQRATAAPLGSNRYNRLARRTHTQGYDELALKPGQTLIVTSGRAYIDS
jgi:hypothetical protein